MKKTTVLSEGMQAAVLEHMKIRAAISRCNSGISQARKLLKYYKETKDESYRESAKKFLITYYNELLALEYLAEKYKVLFGEKFYKSKLTAEKILNN